MDHSQAMLHSFGKEMIFPILMDTIRTTEADTDKHGLRSVSIRVYPWFKEFAIPAQQETELFL
ncbi:MAG: hypothetical protein LGR52_12860, partial [Candidatus Thiosymbion ectosymbiont of Robbea hypermnestra]|nr:hypothetical protein [Candidatus Thiosymbion ectosymbiont of Robbea hypermnestra]